MIISKTTKRIVVLFTLVVASLFLVTCSTNEVSEPLGTTNFGQLELTALTNSSGLEKKDFYTYEDIFLSLEGLIPSEQTNIEVIRGCDECLQSIKRAVVVTDRDGKITNLPIFYHVGVDPIGRRVNMYGKYTVLVTQPPGENPWYRYEICFGIKDDISPDPQIHAFDERSLFKGKASLVGEDVFAMGWNIKTSHVKYDSVKLLVVNDANEYNVGDMLVDVSGAIETVIPDGNGHISSTLIWPAAAATGSYDIVADVYPFGEYTEDDVVSDMRISGLVIQEAPGADHIVVDIATDMMGMVQNTFDELEPIWAKVDPDVRPADLRSWLLPLPHWVPVFVTPHKTLWEQDDQLVTVRTVGTHQMPAYVQMNERSGTIDLFRLRGETKIGYYHPLRLWPGDYDVIVDVNRNFLYDPGIDLLDGGPQVGFTVVSEADTMPKVRLINTASEDILGRGSEPNPYLHGQLLDDENNPIVGVDVKFTVVLGPGYVDPIEDVTDEEGIATTRVYGIGYEVTRVRTEAVVDGKLYYNLVSFYKTLPCNHDQGHSIGQGFLSGP